MKKKIKLIIFLVILICFAVMLLYSGSRLFLGPKLTVDMRIKVDGKNSVPYNITCTNGAGEVQKLHTSNKDGKTIVYIDAFRYDKYIISYDIDTADGVKHLTYGIMKTHDAGPRDSFWYYLDLDKDKDLGEWEARIWLDRKNAEAGAQTILLSVDESSYVQYGP